MGIAIGLRPQCANQAAKRKRKTPKLAFTHPRAGVGWSPLASHVFVRGYAATSRP